MDLLAVDKTIQEFKYQIHEMDNALVRGKVMRYKVKNLIKAATHLDKLLEKTKSFGFEECKTKDI